MPLERLRTTSVIKVDTRDGEREIQLLFGDITALKPSEKVDVIIISAFQGDYTASPTSVIGALNRNLGLRVHDLSADKEEDLRRHFHCWWSKPLDSHLPYRRLMCFETPVFRSFRHPAELVGDVFRCLVPLCKNEETSVIMPLLSTGDQNFSKLRMMRALLDAAVSWIRAGLPLKTLKIVIYSQRPSQLSQDEEQLVDLFHVMKKKIVEAQQHPVEEKEMLFDIYLSYSQDDEARVQHIQELLKREKGDISIFSEHQELNVESAWQKDMYDVMAKCRRIVTFLSPSYLKDMSCVEQYNIAMCCNRSTRRDLLAPFYIQTINPMPTYMALVQYIDCRPKDDGVNEKMMPGIRSFVAIFHMDVKYSLLKPISQHYDVFISYSHKNTAKAKQVLEVLQRLGPDLNIFFDKSELRTGSSWQQTLYNAVDNTDVMLCLVTPDYFSSQVCQEEYNLALAKYVSQAHELEMIPMMIEPVTHFSQCHARVKAIDATRDFIGTVSRVCKGICVYKKFQTKSAHIFSSIEGSYDIQDVLQKHRRLQWESLFTVVRGELQHRAGIAHQQTNISPVKEEPKRDSNTDKQGPSTDQQGPSTDQQGSSTDQQGPSTDQQGSSTDQQGSSTDQQGPSTDQQGSSTDQQGPSTDQQGSSTDKQGPDVPQNLDQDQKAGKEQNSEETQTEPKQFDLAVICSDYKYGFFFHNLLCRRAPELSCSFDVESEKVQWDSLDSAKLIVLLLTPNCVNSGKHIDEFHVALARHRMTEGQPVLYPIIVRELPKWPTYFHLVPARIACYDEVWREVIRDLDHYNPDNTAPYLSKDALWAKLDTRLKVGTNLLPEVTLALSAACDDVIAIVKAARDGEKGEGKNTVINNIVQLTLETAAGQQNLKLAEIPASQCTQQLPEVNSKLSRESKPTPVVQEQAVMMADQGSTPVTPHKISQSKDVAQVTPHQPSQTKSDKASAETSPHKTSLIPRRPSQSQSNACLLI